MTTRDRHEDRRRHQEFTDLLNDTLTNARKALGLSREQIAALLNRGVDDPCMVSKALLDKICEGGDRAKFPLHKMPRLGDITGDPSLLHWLARECGHLAIPMPLSGGQSAEGLLDMVERQADAVKAYRAAVCREGEGGTRITPAEAAKVSVSLDLLMASAAALKAQLQHDAHNPHAAASTTLRAFEAAKAAQGGAR